MVFGTMHLYPVFGNENAGDGFFLSLSFICLRIAPISAMTPDSRLLKPSFFRLSCHLFNIKRIGSSKQVVIVDKTCSLFSLTMKMDSSLSQVSSQTFFDLMSILWHALSPRKIYNPQSIHHQSLTKSDSVSFQNIKKTINGFLMYSDISYLHC